MKPVGETVGVALFQSVGETVGVLSESCLAVSEKPSGNRRNDNSDRHPPYIDGGVSESGAITSDSKDSPMYLLPLICHVCQLEDRAVSTRLWWDPATKQYIVVPRCRDTAACMKRAERLVPA